MAILPSSVIIAAGLIARFSKTRQRNKASFQFQSNHEHRAYGHFDSYSPVTFEQLRKTLADENLTKRIHTRKFRKQRDNINEIKFKLKMVTCFN